MLEGPEMRCQAHGKPMDMCDICRPYPLPRELAQFRSDREHGRVSIFRCEKCKKCQKLIPKSPQYQYCSAECFSAETATT